MAFRPSRAKVTFEVGCAVVVVVKLGKNEGFKLIDEDGVGEPKEENNDIVVGLSVTVAIDGT